MKCRGFGCGSAADVDFEKNTLTVTGGDRGTKNYESRIVPMTDALRALLLRLHDERIPKPSDAISRILCFLCLMWLPKRGWPQKAQNAQKGCMAPNQQPGRTDLTRHPWLTTMSDMQATARDFTRKFPVYRRAAKAGQTVRVRDRDGVTYVFARVANEAPSLSDVAGHLLGSVNSGVRKKSLDGYGQD